MRIPRSPALDDEALAEALARLASASRDMPGMTPGDRSRLEHSTGFLGPHLDEALQRAFRPYTPAACRRLVRQARHRASPTPPGRLLAILAGPIPAVTTGVVFPALAARYGVQVRPSSRFPDFPRLLNRLIKSLAPDLSPSVSLWSPPAMDPHLLREVAECPVVLAYGTDRTIETLGSLRQGRPLLGGGHRESLILVDRTAIQTPQQRLFLSRAIAEDTCLYNQQGCLSPTFLLLEEGPDTWPFLDSLWDAMERTSRRWPVASPPLSEQARLRLAIEDLRDRTLLPGGSLRYGPDAPLPCLAVLPPGCLPLRPSPGHRVLQVIPFTGQPDLPGLLPDLAGRLQGVAVAGRSELAASVLVGPYRPPYLCRPGQLQSPPAGWPENGQPLHLALAELSGDRRR